MKTRTTIILLLLAIGLGVWIKFFESKKPNTVEAQREAGLMLNFDRESLTGINIQNGDDLIELSRQNGKWRLTAPVKDQADGAIVDNLISDLEDWHKEGTIPAREVNSVKGRLNEFGLVQPKLRLRLIGPKAPPEILLGKDTAFSGQMYARFANSKEVFVAGDTVRNDIAKKADDFRDRKLTDLTTAQVDRAVLKSPAGEIELAKKEDRWEIEKPLKARADDQKINDLLAQMTNARIQEFISDDRGDLHAEGLSEPRGAMTLFSDGDKTGRTLEVGSATPKIKDAVYVRYLPRHGVYAVDGKVAGFLDLRPNDLRDRHLLRLDENNLDRIHLEAAGHPPVVLARHEQSWTIASENNQPANADEVRRLLDVLRDQQITRFVADTASDLAKYGLDHPQLRLVFSSFASGNTAETSAGEQPYLTLSFGKAEGNEVYARVDEEPFVVAVDQALLGKIWTDPSQWQALSVFKFKPDEIHRLSRVTDREESLERNGPGKWKWIKGSGAIDTNDLESLLNTLATLRAVRWIGAATPAEGFEQPKMVITFTTSPDDKELHKLTIGNPTENNMWSAKVDGRNGAFLVSHPDMTAFELPLIQAAPSSSGAAPAPAEMSPTISPTVGPATTPSATVSPR